MQTSKNTKNIGLLEDAACDLDSTLEKKLGLIEDALCELDMQKGERVYNE